MSSLNREQWLALRDELEGTSESEERARLTSGPGYASVEFDNGISHTDIYFCQAATDIRIGDLQFIVSRGRLVVLRQHPPYPIARWTVIYDGGLPK